MSKNNFCGDIFEHLQEFIGETVTIFTTSGGQSGCGFTGVILFINPCFVRLITNIGPAPGCALGNGCNRNFNFGRGGSNNNCGAIGSVGSVTDIPIDRISAFVHNAV